MVRSSFFEFNVAVSGMFGARAALEAVNHNISNAAIKGYSRQYVEQRATSPLTYSNGKGMIGTGIETYGIGQMRSFYLDLKYWNERAVAGEYGSKNTQLTTLETMLNGLSETGLNGGIDAFFTTLQSLSTNAFDDTYRTNVVQTGQTLCTFLNNTAEAFKKQQRDINEEIKAVTQRINSLGQQIGSLNDQIWFSEIDGSKANDLIV